MKTSKLYTGFGGFSFIIIERGNKNKCQVKIKDP